MMPIQRIATETKVTSSTSAQNSSMNCDVPGVSPDAACPGAAAKQTTAQAAKRARDGTLDGAGSKVDLRIPDRTGQGLLTGVGHRCFANAAWLAAKTSLCSEWPCASIVTTAGKFSTSNSQMASGEPNFSSK